jgi:L-rhamnose mutarotase
MSGGQIEATTGSGMSEVQRRASMVRLRPDKQEEYLRLHAAVWPEVLDQIARSGLRNYSIFLRDGLLVSYYEYAGDDLERDLAAMAEDPATQRWWELTDPCQEALPGASGREKWVPMAEVFHTP